MKHLFWCMVLLAVTAGARIEWKQTETTLQILPAQTSAEAVFKFINASDEPVSFSNIEITCGCLFAKPFKPSDAPGEKGPRVITLNLNNRCGKQHKRVFPTPPMDKKPN